MKNGMPKGAKRLETMKQVAEIVKKQSERGDMALAWQAARNWRWLATAAEEAKAPKYLKRWF